jgi:hypothetical protein
VRKTDFGEAVHGLGDVPDKLFVLGVDVRMKKHDGEGFDPPVGQCLEGCAYGVGIRDADWNYLNIRVAAP